MSELELIAKKIVMERLKIIIYVLNILLFLKVNLFIMVKLLSKKAQNQMMSKLFKILEMDLIVSFIQSIILMAHRCFLRSEKC